MEAVRGSTVVVGVLAKIFRRHCRPNTTHLPPLASVRLKWIILTSTAISSVQRLGPCLMNLRHIAAIRGPVSITVILRWAGRGRFVYVEELQDC